MFAKFVLTNFPNERIMRLNEMGNQAFVWIGPIGFNCLFGHNLRMDSVEIIIPVFFPHVDNFEKFVVKMDIELRVRSYINGIAEITSFEIVLGSCRTE